MHGENCYCLYKIIEDYKQIIFSLHNSLLHQKPVSMVLG